MYNSQYYTCEQIDQRLLQGYLDDYNSQNGTNLTKSEFLGLLYNTIGRNNLIDSLVTQVGYFECSTPAGTAGKTITIANYNLFAGGSMKVKFVNSNTANNVNLNINSQGALYQGALYYQGRRASSTNSWDEGEVVEVYYDGTSFYANNVTGGSGDGAFDISVNNPINGEPAVYTDLADALAGTNVPVSKRKGGMTVKYIERVDENTNRYVQYTCILDSLEGTPYPFRNINNWQLSVILDGSITTKKTDFDIFVDKVASDAYLGAIAELYVIAPIIDGSDICLKIHNNDLYLRTTTNGTITQGTWVCRVNISQCVNQKVYTLVCTTASDTLGVDVGDTVGYIIYKNVEKLLLITDPTPGKVVDTYWVRDMSKSPIINSYIIINNDFEIQDGSVTYDKLSDDLKDKIGPVAGGGIVFSDRGVSQVENYEKYVAGFAEFYCLLPKVDGLYYRLKTKDSILYFRVQTGSGSADPIALKVSMNLTSSMLGTVITIEAANTIYPDVYDFGVAAGDVIGYAVIKNDEDGEVLLEVSDSSAGANLSNDVFDLIKWKQIYEYIEGGGGSSEIPDGSITTSKIQDGSVTLPKLAFSMEKGVGLNLPSEIVVPVGHTLQLFHRSVVQAINPYNYQIEVVCSHGANYPRYFEYAPKQNEIGSHALTYIIRTNDDTELCRKSTSIKVIAPISGGVSVSNGNILVVGASAVNSGNIQCELKRILTTDTGNTKGNGIVQKSNLYPDGKNLTGVNFVGRVNKSVTFKEIYEQSGSVVENTVATINVNYEATGGWAWATYITGRIAYRFIATEAPQLSLGAVYTCNGVSITIVEVNGFEVCGTYNNNTALPESGTLIKSSGNGPQNIEYESYTSESYSPFSYNGEADFAHYASEYCSNDIDILIFQLGTNSVFKADYDANDVKSSITTLLDAFHTDFPQGKVILTSPPLPDPNGGMGGSYGASSLCYWNAIARKFYSLYQVFQEVASDSTYSSYVSFVHSAIMCDIENCYQYKDANINARIALTERLGYNGVHPGIIGYLQIADSIFYKLNELLVTSN